MPQFWDLTRTRTENQGYYAPVPYRFYGEAKIWCNHLENRKGLPPLATNNQIYRLLKPRHLCFLNNPDDSRPHGIQVRAVSEWEHDEGQETSLNYLFVAYSFEQFSTQSPEDMKALARIAEHACRAAKLPAF